MFRSFANWADAARLRDRGSQRRAEERCLNTERDVETTAPDQTHAPKTNAVDVHERIGKKCQIRTPGRIRCIGAWQWYRGSDERKLIIWCETSSLFGQDGSICLERLRSLGDKFIDYADLPALSIRGPRGIPYHIIFIARRHPVQSIIPNDSCTLD